MSDLSQIIQAIRSGDVRGFFSQVEALGEHVFDVDAQGHSLRWHAEQVSNFEILTLIAQIEQGFGRRMTDSAVPTPEHSPMPDSEPESSLNRDVCLEELRALRLQGRDKLAYQKELIRLIRKGDPNAVTEDEESMLLLAARLGANETIKQLLLAGAILDVEDEELMLLACECNALNLVRELVREGVDVNLENGEPMRCAIRAGALDVARFLIEEGAEVEEAVDEAKDIAIIRFLIENGADIDESGFLHSAVIKNDIGLVTMLLGMGADVNAKSPSYIGSPLFSVKTVKMAQYLLKQGAEVNGKSSDGRTALFYADDAELAEWLIKQGADVNIRDSSGRYPLDVRFNNEKIRAVLRSHGAKLDGEDLLYNAAEECDLEEMALLFQYGARVKNNEALVEVLNSLSYADEKRNDLFRTALVLIEHGASIHTKSDEYEKTILHYARTPDEVKKLVELGADVHAKDKFGRTPIYCILEEVEGAGPYEMASFLLKHGASVTGFSSFFMSNIANKDLELAELLIRHGATHQFQISCPALEHTHTPSLFYAVYIGHEKLALTLIEKGANINEKLRIPKEVSPYYGGVERTILEFSILRKSLPIVESLLKHGADMNLSNRSESGLHMAVYNDHYEMVELLLENNFPLPNDILFHVKSVRVAEILMKHGANKNCTNYFNYTPAENFKKFYSTSDIADAIIARGGTCHLARKEFVSWVQNNYEHILFIGSIVIFVVEYALVLFFNIKPFAILYLGKLIINFVKGLL